MQVFILDIDRARALINSTSVVLADCYLKKTVVVYSFMRLDIIFSREDGRNLEFRTKKKLRKFFFCAAKGFFSL